jgi:hypothetical protein
MSGRAGFVLMMDLGQLFSSKSSDPGGLYYSRPSVLDAHELLRELIDGTDELRNCLILVTAPAAFLTDEQRGLDAYWALKARIIDEVRDANRENPLAALVRLGAN